MDFAVALAVALVATPIAAIVARRLGIVDDPGPLKVHSRPVPYLGGAAVVRGHGLRARPDRPATPAPTGPRARRRDARRPSPPARGHPSPL